MILDVVKIGASLIDKLIPDKAAAAEAKLKLLELEQRGDLAHMQEAASIIREEAKSSQFLTATWRPITMLVFVFIIANNYILYPYLSLFIESAPKLEIPPDMWDLLKIGIGGYTVGRTVEKAVKSYSEKGK